MKVIAISGTPGTGKTTLAKLMQKKPGYQRLDLHEHYKEISTGYNRKKRCYDIDLKKFEKLVKDEMKIAKKEKGRGLIIDSHISHLLPPRLVDLCIILTCPDLKKLERRLKRREYSKQKIKENLDAEIFQVCLTEAKEMGHKVMVVDVSKRINHRKLMNRISKSL